MQCVTRLFVWLFFVKASISKIPENVFEDQVEKPPDSTNNMLATEDFQTYAVNLGNTITDLLRQEIAMLGKIDSASSTGNDFVFTPIKTSYPGSDQQHNTPLLHTNEHSQGSLGNGVSSYGSGPVFSIGSNNAPITTTVINLCVPGSTGTSENSKDCVPQQSLKSLYQHIIQNKLNELMFPATANSNNSPLLSSEKPLSGQSTLSQLSNSLNTNLPLQTDNINSRPYNNYQSNFQATSTQGNSQNTQLEVGEYEMPPQANTSSHSTTEIEEAQSPLQLTAHSQTLPALQVPQLQQGLALTTSQTPSNNIPAVVPSNPIVTPQQQNHLYNQNTHTLTQAVMPASDSNPPAAVLPDQTPLPQLPLPATNPLSNAPTNQAPLPQASLPAAVVNPSTIASPSQTPQTPTLNEVPNAQTPVLAPSSLTSVTPSQDPLPQEPLPAAKDNPLAALSSNQNSQVTASNINPLTATGSNPLASSILNQNPGSSNPQTSSVSVNPLAQL